MKMINILIDTDVARDDIGAILYLLKHPEVSIKAMSVSCGLTYIDVGADNLLRLLNHLGGRDIPVITGAKTPLKTDHTFPPKWRNCSNTFFGLDLPETDLKPFESENLASVIEEQPEKIIVVVLGPLTNIAELFQTNPTVKEKIEQIIIMGGAVNTPGNVGQEYSPIPNFDAEWNIYIDPHAADIVFKSGVPLTLVPLDATNNLPITEELKEKLVDTIVTPEAKIAFQFMIPGACFWDQLTAVVVTDPSVVTLEDHHIEIIVEEGNSSGKTVSVSGEINTRVAIAADAQAFENHFFKILNLEKT